MSDDGIDWDKMSKEAVDFPGWPGLGDTEHFAQLPFGHKVLDMGSNICRWYPAFKWLNTLNHGRQMVEYHAYDGSSIAHDLAKQRYPEIDFTVGDIYDLSNHYESGSFDSVFSAAFIQHFSNANKRRIMNEVYKILKANGQFIMAEQMFPGAADDYTNDRSFSPTGWHIFMKSLNFYPSEIRMPFIAYRKL